MNNAPVQKFCPNCGQPLEPNAAFCPNCGQKMPQGAPSQASVAETVILDDAPDNQQKQNGNDPISQFNAQNTPPSMQNQNYFAAAAPAAAAAAPQYQQPQTQTYAQPQQNYQQPAYQQPAPQRQSFRDQPAYNQQPPAYTAPATPAYSGDTSPLSTGGFIGTMLAISLLPIVGFILMLVWAFSSSGNVNRRNFCRASLILGLIAVAIAVIFTIIGGTVISGIVNDITSSLMISSSLFTL